MVKSREHVLNVLGAKLENHEALSLFRGIRASHIVGGNEIGI